MKYAILQSAIHQLDSFESDPLSKNYTSDFQGFINWYNDTNALVSAESNDVNWEGKSDGRSSESIICTLLNNMSKYAKTYSKAAMSGTAFSTQDEFIFLINLKEKGPMSKMELIKMNIHTKSSGIKIIDRLLTQKWVGQTYSETDKRSKLIAITPLGLNALSTIMDNIRLASKAVVADLTNGEKNLLIGLLQKLELFHNRIFLQSANPEDLLDLVQTNYLNH